MLLLRHHAPPQACVKDSGADDRVVITIKLLEPLMGLPGLLAALVALDMAEGAAAGDVAAGRLLEMPMAPGGLAGSGGAAGGVAVPGLDMSQVRLLVCRWVAAWQRKPWGQACMQQHQLHAAAAPAAVSHCAR